ncbi:MAG: HEAT repeat domain-containing protein, partial [Euryarchaeota archaeon]|nr:HEAT repeat domain-containing protein [Euryarchaeota archaeon]
ALADSDRGVRDVAAEALGHFGVHAYPPLMEALTSPQWEVRVGALVALRLIDIDMNPLKIVTFLADENRYVRREAAKTIGRVGGVNVLGDLEFALLDPDPGVRIRAINGIVRHADPVNVQRLLVPLLQDDDSTVRLRVNEELRKISGR